MKNLFAFLFFVCFTSASLCAETIILGSSQNGLRQNKVEDFKIAGQNGFNQVMENDGVKAEFKMYPSTQDLIDGIAKNEVQVLFGSALEVIKAEQYLNIHDCVSPIYGGKPTERMLLIVRTDDHIKALSQLEGKYLDIPIWLEEDIGSVYLELLLQENKLPAIKKFFGGVQISKNANQSITNVFFGKSDAALVAEAGFEVAAELNPQLKSKFIILATSQPQIGFLACPIKAIDTRMTNILKKAGLNMKSKPGGRNVLKLMGASEFIEANPENLNPTREMLAKQQLIEKTANKPNKK